jgi:hypothetical protein
MTFTPLQYSAALWEATGLSNQQLLARSSAGVVIHKGIWPRKIRQEFTLGAMARLSGEYAINC